MELTTLQRRTVEDIVKFYGKEKEFGKEIHFKSPTGSGKTLMATHVISQIMNNNQHEKLIFVIATISSSDLPKAFEEKINQYKADLPFSDFEVEYIESPSAKGNGKVKDAMPQIKIVQNKVYIFGKATFGKGRIFTEQEVLSDFIKECKQQGYKVVYIRDEAHIGGGKPDEGAKTFEHLMQDNADFIVKMTATFDNKSTVRRVELKESDLKDETKNDGKWLIKCNPQIINDETINDEELIEQAIKKFKEIKKEYNTLDCHIQPAMLIQVDSEPTDKEEKEKFHATLKYLKDKLFNNDLSWVQYFGANDVDYGKHTFNNKEKFTYTFNDKEKFTLSKITRNNDPTDCIIFKIGPATGWDIPRACMLLQLRNVCSTNLSIQTIGRIKRNPYPRLAKNDITQKYYIFTNEPKNNKDYDVYEYKVRKEYESEEFAIIKLNKKSRSVDGGKIQEEIEGFLEKNKKNINEQIKSFFVENIFKIQEERLEIKSPILLLKHIERLKAALNKGEKDVLSKIKTLHNKYFPDVSWNKVFLVLFHKFMNDVNVIVGRCVNVDVSYRLHFEKIKPNLYYEVVGKDVNNTVNIANSNYLFTIAKFNNPCEIQSLDSVPEKIISQKIKTHLETIPAKLWVKNPTSSNVYGEYLDENSNDKRSYFDFVLKFNNGNYLYIEVKGKKDIDAPKTELLEKAYTSYFDNMENSLTPAKIVICLAKVEDENNITQRYFYNKNHFNEDLQNKSLGQILQAMNA